MNDGYAKYTERKLEFMNWINIVRELRGYLGGYYKVDIETFKIVDGNSR